jgi:thioredoxin-related protein
MKLIFLSLVLMLSTAGFLHASEWTTDYKTALEQAKAQNKLVLLDFTGSDWCGYCQLLDKEVFMQPEFHHYADQNYILVTVDFPHGKQLPDDLKAQNDTLNKQFKIDGFPTLIVLDADGKELGRTVGYNPGSGPTAVISKLKTFDTRKG